MARARRVEPSRCPLQSVRLQYSQEHPDASLSRACLPENLRPDAAAPRLERPDESAAAPANDPSESESNACRVQGTGRRRCRQRESPPPLGQAGSYRSPGARERCAIPRGTLRKSPSVLPSRPSPVWVVESPARNEKENCFGLYQTPINRIKCESYTDLKI